MYGSYVPRVDIRMAVQTPIELDFTFTDNGNNNYTVCTDISKVSTYDNDVDEWLFFFAQNSKRKGYPTTSDNL